MPKLSKFRYAKEGRGAARRQEMAALAATITVTLGSLMSGTLLHYLG